MKRFAFAVVAFGLSAHFATAQNKAPEPIDPITQAVYRKFGTYRERFALGSTGDWLPGVTLTSIPRFPLPDVDVPFGLATASMNLSDRTSRHFIHLKNLAFLDLSGSNHITDGALAPLAPLTNLTGLNLSRTRITDAGLKDLAPLSNLTGLILTDCRVTAAGLKNLAPLKKLNALNLDNAQITDDALSALREVGLLHALANAQGKDKKRPTSADEVIHLNLSYSRVTDACLKEVASLKNLTELRLKQTAVTGSGLKALAPLKKLAVLDLSNTKVSDAALKDLAELESLTQLHLNETQVRGDGLKDLAPLRNLNLLAVWRMPLTVEAMKGIASLKGVRSLDLAATPVRAAELKELAPLVNLASLNLAGTHIGNADLPALASLKNLEALNLGGTLVDNIGLHELAPLTKLRSLQLSESKVKMSSFSGLAPLKKLNQLDIFANWADESLRELRQMGLLHAWPGATANDGTRPQSADEVAAVSVHFSSNGITDASLKEIALLKNITKLRLSGPMTAGGLRALAPLKKLTTLQFDESYGAPSFVNNGSVRVLREIGLLHVLSTAVGPNGARPTSADEVVSLSVRVSDAGVKELADFKNLTDLNLRHLGGLTDAGLKELSAFPKLKRLNLGFTKVTNGGMKELAPLRELTSLDLSLTDVGDAGLADLARLTKLTTLNLFGTKVTNAGLHHLAPLKNLTYLNLFGPQPEKAIDDATLRELRQIGLLHALPQAVAKNGERPKSADDVHAVRFVETAVGDDGLKELTAFPNLASLDLRESKTTDKALKALAPLKLLDLLTLDARYVSNQAMHDLRDIGLLHALFVAEAKGHARPKSASDVVFVDFIEGTQVTDVGYASLTEFKNLSSLYTNRAIGDAGLKELTPLHNLKILDLRYTRVTDSGLSEFAGFNKLATLYLEGTKVTNAGVAELRKALPKVQVVR